MTAPRFVTVNLAEEATITASTATVGLPATNLQTPNRYAVWRATGNSALLTVDLGSSQSVDFVALLGINGTAAMTRRVRVSANSNLSSPTHDSGTATATELDTELRQWCYLLSSPASGRYVGIDIADAALSTIEAGHLGVGLMWRPTYSYRHGGRRYVRDLSVVTESDAGNVFVDRKTRLRCWQFTMQADRTESEGGKADDLAHLLGRSGSLWGIRDPDVVPVASQLYWGLLRDPPEISDDHYSLRAMPMTLQERA